MAIDFEAEGLLDGLEGEARDARLMLLCELEEEGASLDELRSAVAEDRLALLPTERFIEGSGERYTLDEIAEEAGVDPEFLARLRSALGIAPPEPGSRYATEADLDAAKRMRALLDAGLPEDGIVENSRVMGLAMAQVAATNNALVGNAMLRAGDTELEAAHRYLEAAKALAPMLAPAVEYSLRLHLREQLRQAAVNAAALSSGTIAGAQEMTACFADLVDFTRLGQTLDFEELGSVTSRLGELAREVATPPVRLVKLIGDAAMLVSPDNDAVLEAALNLLDAAEAEGRDFPTLRAGLARGAVVGRGGDFYGHTVNLASRICDFAFPAAVLCDEQAQECAEDDRFAFSFAGARRLKGVDGHVKLFRARKNSPASA
jgi:adenylate cyclase